MSINILQDPNRNNPEPLKVDMKKSSSTFADLEGLVGHYKNNKNLTNGKYYLKDPVFPKP